MSKDVPKMNTFGVLNYHNITGDQFESTIVWNTGIDPPLLFGCEFKKFDIEIRKLRNDRPGFLTRSASIIYDNDFRRRKIRTFLKL
jgi:hypothetical protein